MAEDGAVSYSVKELLARLDGKVDGLFVAIGSKADKSELEQVRTDVRALEIQQARSSGGKDWFWRAVMAAPGVGSLLYLLAHGRSI